MADTLCPVCGGRVEDFSKHVNSKHKELITYQETPKPVPSPTRAYRRRNTEVKILLPPQIIDSSWEHCGEKVRTIDSRPVNDYILRRKQCIVCKSRFSTYEFRIENKDSLR